MPPRQTAADRPRVPVGGRRLLARLPVVLFRAGLGWVFGRRLLLLHHTGRVTGLHRRVVLEAVEYEPADGSWIVASGSGPGADWYRNLRAEPKTVIEVGTRHHAVTAHFLTPDDGAGIMARHARRRPRAARRLCAFTGLPADGTESGYREAGRAVPFVRLEAGPGSRRA
ncbi:nitroreductase family deazaflavin-dependent oxidoreductase [Streptomyces sediminimaris]|uniref:nitroreductase family deazaflavin-dependent oxidoreductase n=1 Tax=Streptomyces sediminimaris TaxID=3383721 RepID=UPI00399BCF54